MNTHKTPALAEFPLKRDMATACGSQGPMSQQNTDGSGRNELHPQKLVRQSIAYTKSPFEVFPIGRHTTGLGTLLAGGAPARFGVCANAGEVNSTNARATFFISISRDMATTTQSYRAALC